MATQFATKQAIKAETPTWAKYMFRATMILTTVAMFIISSDTAIESTLVVRICLYLKGFDMLMLGFSKMFGISNEDETT